MGFPVFLFTVLLSTITFIFNLSGSNISHDMTFISWIYYIFSALGHAFTFSLVLYFIYALIVGAIRNVKISLFLYCLFGALLQLLFVLDGIVFNIYRFHINGFVLDLAFGAGSDVFVFSAGLYLKFFLMVTVVAILPFYNLQISSPPVFILSKKIYYCNFIIPCSLSVSGSYRTCFCICIQIYECRPVCNCIALLLSFDGQFSDEKTRRYSR